MMYSLVDGNVAFSVIKPCGNGVLFQNQRPILIELCERR